MVKLSSEFLEFGGLLFYLGLELGLLFEGL